MLFRSPLPDVDIPQNVSLTEYVLFAPCAAARDDASCMLDGITGREWSHAELVHDVKRLAGGLQQVFAGCPDSGVRFDSKPRPTLALVAPNSPWYALVFHAAAWAGGVVTTISPAHTASEMRTQLLDSGATVLVVSSAVRHVVLDAIEGTHVRPDNVLTIEMSDHGRSVEQLIQDSAPLEAQAPVSCDDIVVLPFSSGTTGMNKGVMLSHGNCIANLVQVAQVVPHEPGDVALAVLPFFHIYGLQVVMNALLARSVSIVTLPRFELEQVLTVIQERKVSWFYAVPPIILALAKHPLVEKYDLSSLKVIFSGAAPLSAQLTQDCASRLGCLVLQGYGMTEMSPVSHSAIGFRNKPGSSGVTIPSTECMIVDPTTGAPCGSDTDGELWVRGPQVMKGYLNAPEATAATIDGQGWLHTGDVAHFDADGFIYIVDRIKELIKYKGFQVVPAELEGILLTHPAIADAAVIGVPDRDGAAGELPKAYVVLKPGTEASVSERDIQHFVVGKVATYKQIHFVEFTDKIPRAASGKILRRELRDRRDAHEKAT
ncbi:4-coumarate--CoA ligase 2 [Porphyridium purpureum]|uniref:4-coumarate--CoA ligase 2 n=1 Tax=Porphyridium purpureum TaxID=35688 RepID=A0A5J4Z368_PORPP|nr:4-coumarate--CoA ligase 2 [Porphyridium purpureum]|eukprot:POR4094..scf208_2